MGLNMGNRLYDLMDWPSIEGIVYSECDEPMELLGGRICKDGFLIQTFAPDAVEIDVRVDGRKKLYPMEKMDEAGFFAVLLPGRKKVSYTFVKEDVYGKKTEYKEKIKEFKEKKKELADKKKAIGKGNAGFETVAEEEKALKAEEKKYQETVARYEEENYKKPVAKFRTVTKSIRYYEILDQIDLIIHVTADEEILDDILEHAYDLKAIGRSEDFVEVLDVQKVQLEQGEETVESSNCAYLNYEDIKEEKIFSGDMGRGERIAAGTIYYFGKKYEIKEGKRIFSNKKRVLYTSNFGIDETSENIWMDKTEENVYIVNFINFKE